MSPLYNLFLKDALLSDKCILRINNKEIRTTLWLCSSVWIVPYDYIFCQWKNWFCYYSRTGPIVGVSCISIRIRWNKLYPLKMKSVPFYVSFFLLKDATLFSKIWPISGGIKGNSLLDIKSKIVRRSVKESRRTSLPFLQVYETRITL